MPRQDERPAGLRSAHHAYFSPAVTRENDARITVIRPAEGTPRRAAKKAQGYVPSTGSAGQRQARRRRQLPTRSGQHATGSHHQPPQSPASSAATIEPRRNYSRPWAETPTGMRSSKNTSRTAESDHPKWQPPTTRQELRAHAEKLRSAPAVPNVTYSLNGSRVSSRASSARSRMSTPMRHHHNRSHHQQRRSARSSQQSTPRHPARTPTHQLHGEHKQPRQPLQSPRAPNQLSADSIAEEPSPRQAPSSSVGGKKRGMSVFDRLSTPKFFPKTFKQRRKSQTDLDSPAASHSSKPTRKPRHRALPKTPVQEAWGDSSAPATATATPPPLHMTSTPPRKNSAVAHQPHEPVTDTHAAITPRSSTSSRRPSVFERLLNPRFFPSRHRRRFIEMEIKKQHQLQSEGDGHSPRGSNAHRQSVQSTATSVTSAGPRHSSCQSAVASHAPSSVPSSRSSYQQRHRHVPARPKFHIAPSSGIPDILETENKILAEKKKRKSQQRQSKKKGSQDHTIDIYQEMPASHQQPIEPTSFAPLNPNGQHMAAHSTPHHQHAIRRPLAVHSPTSSQGDDGNPEAETFSSAMPPLDADLGEASTTLHKSIASAINRAPPKTTSSAPAKPASPSPRKLPAQPGSPLPSQRSITSAQEKQQRRQPKRLPVPSTSSNKYLVSGNVQEEDGLLVDTVSANMEELYAPGENEGSPLDGLSPSHHEQLDASALFNTSKRPQLPSVPMSATTKPTTLRGRASPRPPTDDAALAPNDTATSSPKILDVHRARLEERRQREKELKVVRSERAASRTPTPGTTPSVVSQDVLQRRQATERSARQEVLDVLHVDMEHSNSSSKAGSNVSSAFASRGSSLRQKSPKPTTTPPLSLLQSTSREPSPGPTQSSAYRLVQEARARAKSNREAANANAKQGEGAALKLPAPMEPATSTSSLNLAPPSEFLAPTENQEATAVAHGSRVGEGSMVQGHSPSEQAPPTMRRKEAAAAHDTKKDAAPISPERRYSADAEAQRILLDMRTEARRLSTSDLATEMTGSDGEQQLSSTQARITREPSLVRSDSVSSVTSTGSGSSAFRVLRSHGLRRSISGNVEDDVRSDVEAAVQEAKQQAREEVKRQQEECEKAEEQAREQARQENDRRTKEIEEMKRLEEEKRAAEKERKRVEREREAEELRARKEREEAARREEERQREAEEEKLRKQQRLKQQKDFEKRRAQRELETREKKEAEERVRREEALWQQQQAQQAAERAAKEQQQIAERRQRLLSQKEEQQNALKEEAQRVKDSIKTSEEVLGEVQSAEDEVAALRSQAANLASSQSSSTLHAAQLVEEPENNNSKNQSHDSSDGAISGHDEGVKTLPRVASASEHAEAMRIAREARQEAGRRSRHTSTSEDAVPDTPSLPPPLPQQQQQQQQIEETGQVTSAQKVQGAIDAARRRRSSANSNSPTKSASDGATAPSLPPPATTAGVRSSDRRRAFAQARAQSLGHPATQGEADTSLPAPTADQTRARAALARAQTVDESSSTAKSKVDQLLEQARQRRLARLTGSAETTPLGNAESEAPTKRGNGTNDPHTSSGEKATTTQRGIGSPKSGRKVEALLEEARRRRQLRDQAKQSTSQRGDDGDTVQAPSEPTETGVSGASTEVHGHRVVVRMTHTEDGLGLLIDDVPHKKTKYNIRVKTLRENGKAHMAGVHVFDRLVSVQGIDMSGKTKKEVAATIKATKMGEVLEFVLLRGIAA